MGKRLEEIERICQDDFHVTLTHDDFNFILSEIKRLRGAIEKHIIEFDKLMKEMPSNHERGMKLAESVGDLQGALKGEE